MAPTHCVELNEEANDRKLVANDGDGAAGSWYNPWVMTDVLALLIEERDRLNEAIAVLGGPRRRGRPTGAPKKAAKKAAKGKEWSPAERQAASERMKKHWAKRKRAAKRNAVAGIANS